MELSATNKRSKIVAANHRNSRSLKPRNRPSFVNILQHLQILKKELEELGQEVCTRTHRKFWEKCAATRCRAFIFEYHDDFLQEWLRRCEIWREGAKNIEYPNSLKKHGAELMQQQHRKWIRFTRISYSSISKKFNWFCSSLCPKYYNCKLTVKKCNPAP